MLTELIDRQEKYGIIASLLQLPEGNGHSRRAWQDLDSFFAAIREAAAAEQEDFPQEAEVFEDLEQARTQIRTLLHFPLLSRKVLVGVGGAFSAGKSSFLNSLLGKAARILPEGIDPVTALPTYLIRGESNIQAAVTLRGHIQELDLENFKFLSHKAKEILKIDLPAFLRHLAVVSTSLPYENLAFLDSPGYSSGKGEGEFSDSELAAQRLGEADVLLWCADVQAGGLSQTDLQFLKKLTAPRPGRPDRMAVFLVITKANMKSTDETDKIVKTMTSACSRAGIALAGAALHSKRKPQEYPAAELKTFLEGLNRNPREDGWEKAVETALDRYADHHRRVLDQELSPLLEKLNKITVRLKLEPPPVKTTSFFTSFSKFLDNESGKNAKLDSSQELRSLVEALAPELLATASAQFRSHEALKETFIALKTRWAGTLKPDLRLALQECTKEFHRDFKTKISGLAGLEKLEATLKAEVRQLIEEEKLRLVQTEFPRRDEKIPVSGTAVLAHHVSAARWYNPLTWGRKKEELREHQVTVDQRVEVLPEEAPGAFLLQWRSRLIKRTEDLFSLALRDTATEGHQHLAEAAPPLVKAALAQVLTPAEELMTWAQDLSPLTIRDQGIDGVTRLFRRRLDQELDRLSQVPLIFIQNLQKEI